MVSCSINSTGIVFLKFATNNKRMEKIQQLNICHELCQVTSRHAMSCQKKGSHCRLQVNHHIKQPEKAHQKKVSSSYKNGKDLSEWCLCGSI